MHDIARGVNNKWFYLIVVFIVIVMVRPASVTITENRNMVDYLNFFAEASTFAYIKTYAPMFCMIAYACSFHDEYRSGFTRYALLHSDRRKYMLGKIIAVSTSGALVMAIPIAIVSIFSYIWFQPVSQKALPAYYLNSAWADILRKFGGEVVLLGKVLMAGAYGAVWALPGLVCSTVLMNRLASVIVPFALYHIAWAFYGRSLYFPMRFIFADEIGFITPATVLGIELLYWFVFAYLSYVGMQRRCRSV